MNQPKMTRSREDLIRLRRELAERPCRLLEQVVAMDQGDLAKAIAFCAIANAGNAQEAEIAAVLDRVRELQAELSLLVLFFHGHVLLSADQGALAARFSPLADAEGRRELEGTDWLGAVTGS